MGIREQLGHAINTSDLGEDDRYITDVNRIAAFGQAGKLGRLLWHWKYGRDESCAQPAFNLLVRRAAKRLKIRHVGDEKQAYETLRLACAQMLREWLQPYCRSCQGARIGTNDRGVVTECPSCNGAGLYRYGDTERMRALKVSREDYEQTWARRLYEIYGTITGSDAETGAVVRTQLGDDAARVLAEVD